MLTVKSACCFSARLVRTKETRFPSGDTARSDVSPVPVADERVLRQAVEVRTVGAHDPDAAVCAPLITHEDDLLAARGKGGIPVPEVSLRLRLGAGGGELRKPVPRGEISATEPLAGGVSYVKAISLPSGDQSGVDASRSRSGV